MSENGLKEVLCGASNYNTRLLLRGHKEADFPFNWEMLNDRQARQSTGGVTKLNDAARERLFLQSAPPLGKMAALDYGFSALGFTRAAALAHFENEASWRVLEKLGMARAGTLLDDGEELLRFIRTR